MKYLITGANRGIGAELTRQLKAQGHEVIATTRAQVDLGNEASILAFAKTINQVDVLINNAGVMGGETTMDDLVATFKVNAAGPLLLARALAPALARGERKLLVHITSRMGSITDNESGGYYAYRMSKAALNMASKSFSVDHKDLVSVVLHPGWVQTDMGGQGAPLTPEASVTGMLKVISGLSSKDSGKFYDYTGAALPF